MNDIPDDGLTPSALAVVLSQIRQAKAEASEASGEAGAASKAACERYHIEAKALNWVTWLSNQEADRRISVLRSFAKLAEKAGFFDQRDLFDDTGAQFDKFAELTNGQDTAVKGAILGVA